jgi:hypothetical protein
MMDDLLLERSAVISECGLYRYRLERDIGRYGNTALAFIMVNPSTADARQDDPTIRKCMGFAERNGFGRLIVGNKFAFRATDVKALIKADNAIGPENDAHLERIMRDADILVAAWGPLGKLPRWLRSRWYAIAAIAERVGKPLHCFGTAQDGHPRHPLMLPYDTALSDWATPAAGDTPATGRR